MLELSDNLDARLRRTAAQNGLSIEQLLEQMLAERGLLDAVLDAIPVSTTIADATQPDLPLTHVNAAFEQMTGYSTADILGENCRLLQGEATESADKQQIRESLTAGKPSDVVLTNYRKNGSPFYNRLRLTPVYNDQNQLTHYIGIQADVTVSLEIQRHMLTGDAAHEPTTLPQRLDTLTKQIARNEHRLASIISMVPDAFLMIDADQRIVMCNRGVQRIFGYTPEEILGQPLNKLIPDDANTVHETHFHRFAESSDVYLEMQGRKQIQGKRKDGSTFPARASISKHWEENHLLFAVILQDMTWEFETRHQLEKSETRYRMISELSSDYAYAYNVNDKGEFELEWITDAVEAVTGYSIDEIMRNGGTLESLVHPDDIAELRTTWQALIAKPSYQTNEARMVRKDGTEFIVQSRYRSVVDRPDGRVTCIYGASQDITARRTAEQKLVEEHNLLSDIMETSPAGITVVDAAGNITYSNRRANEIQRTTETDVTERSYDSPEWRHTDFDGNPWPEEKQPFVRVMQTKQPVWNVRHAIESNEGERVYLSINGMPQLDEHGEVRRIVFTIEDVSVQKAWEDNMRALLEREAKLSEMKSRFLSLVSHEFRNPLAVILTSTGILRKYHDRLSRANRAERIHTIENQVNRLDKMLDDISQLNKMQLSERPLKLVHLQLEDYLSTVIEEIELAYPNSPHILYQSDNTCESLVTDEMHFHQILMNLLSNAVKYTPQHKLIWLIVRCQPDETIVIVRDEGIGIPVEDQKALFAAFQRASNVGDIPGTGMGLVILKSSVTALGGKVDFESVEGEGTTFRVHLPKL